MNTHDDSELFIISEEEVGERLDKILAKRLHNIGSRTYFQYLLDEGKVLLNGSPVKKRIKPQAGDEVEIEYILAPELTLTPEAIPLNILYEDRDIIIINKQAGMVVHPGAGNWTGTLVNALLYHCKGLIESSGHGDASLRPGIVHRLDKDTSGVMVAAKTLAAHQKLVEMFARKADSTTIIKEYLAICVGNPGSGTISTPISRHPVNRKMMAVVETGGKEAITHYKTLAHNDRLSLVSITIVTGRTHQIRVHMKHHGTPVLGDQVYGCASLNSKYKTTRQMLHAHSLVFTHPISGLPLTFTAELPPDMMTLSKTIKS